MSTTQHPLTETAAEAMTFNSDDAPDWIGFGPFIIERHTESDHVIALRHLHHPAIIPLTVGGATRISNFLDSITAQHGGDDTVASLVAEIRDLRAQLGEHERATNPAADADRPWEPLGDDEPLNVGDEVRRVLNRITTTAVVASVDEDGNPWAVGASVIGIRRYGTWYVRRAAQELPTASCTVIIPADGRKRVEAKANIVWYANEAVLGPDNRWHGVWRTDSGLAISSVSPGEITPGTWKVADQ